MKPGVIRLLWLRRGNDVISSIVGVVLLLVTNELALPDLVATAKKSTVRVDIEFAARQGQSPERVVKGAGVIVAPGVVATCAHLFDDLPAPAARVFVVPDDGAPELTASLELSNDVALDLAYLKVPGLKNRPAAVASEAPRMGEEVFFIGHPFSLAPSLLGVGVVASDEMAIPTEKYVRQLRLLHASANKGNSGGGVFRRSDGRLIGMIQIKTGAVGPELRALMKARYSKSIAVADVDPVKTLQTVVSEMDEQLNMGVAGFLSVKRISTKAR